MIWRGNAARLRVKPEAGLEVICTGKLSTYPGSSRYQIIVEQVELAGLGALMAMLEERRKRMAAEGLFDAARKKALPFLPESDRGHHLAHGRGDPRYHAPAGGAVSAPGAAVAGGGAGRAGC